MMDVNAIRDRLPGGATLGIVLGSGLQSFVDRLEVEARLPFVEIPGMPEPTVAGHSGEFVRGRLGPTEVLVQSGRVHYYEGHGMDKVVLPTRIHAAMGVRFLMVTNAAGSLRDDLRPGDLMAIEDHINFLGASPLRGGTVPEASTIFCDMTEAYDRAWLAQIEGHASKLGIALPRGVYMAFCGPSFETPAEIRFADRIGATAVGMSTVPEVIAGRALGLRMAGISLITNPAAGRADGPLSHEETLAVSKKGQPALTQLLAAIASDIGSVEESS